MVIKLKKRGERVFENAQQKKTVEALEKKSGFKSSSKSSAVSRDKEPIQAKKKSLRQKSLAAHPKLTKGLEISAGVLGVAAAGLTGGAALAGSLGAGAAARAGPASISATVSAHRLSRSLTGANTLQAEKLLGLGTRTAQRAFIGRPANTGVDKIFSAAGRFATNKKSQALTGSLLKKAGMTTAGLAAAGTLVGTYPFAEFELAEATDKIGIAIFRASQAGDEEEVQRLVTVMDEMLDESVWDKVVSKIPFANVMRTVRKNIAAAQVSAESIRNTVGLEVNETMDFAESQEAARQSKLEERSRDAEYFALIREGKFEEAQELLDTELKGGNEK